MRQLFRLASFLACFLPAAAGALDDPAYRALRGLTPDGRQIALAAPFTLERDAFVFEFSSGTFHLLSPVGGRTVGAVFLGSGRYTLTPATADERAALGFVVGRPGLTSFEDRFSSLVLLFADSTADELALLGEGRVGSPEPAAKKAVEEWFHWQKREFRHNFLIRLLADLYDTPDLRSGVFFAFTDGAELPPSLAAIDPQGLEALRMGDGDEDVVLVVADQVKGGLYYASEPARQVAAGRRTPYRPRFDARHYTLDTRLANRGDLAGTAEIELVAEAAVRVVPLYLYGNLRITRAEARTGADGPWSEVPWIQEPETDYDDFLSEDSNTAVILPAIVEKGGAFTLRLEYAGPKVLDDRGGGTFAVGARTSWYPNAGLFKDTATFALTYRVPAGSQVVSVGELVDTKTENGFEVTTWREPMPIRVAGFNYGKFKKVGRQDPDIGMDLAVFTGSGTPDIIEEINQFLRLNSRSINDRGGNLIQGFGDPSAGLAQNPNISTGPSSLGKLNAEKIAESTLADAVNQLRIGTAYFGPVPNRRLAITQQEAWSFGQSWPSLVFMPYISFLSATQRKDLGMGAGTTEFVDSVGFHEVAHQWWGHHVGWASYRDQWLSEGFAEFAAALATQHTRGWDAYDHFLEQHRKRIVDAVGGTVPHYQVGPLTRGYRLSTYRSPGAGFLIYSKGAYVLHMLRMLMMDPAAANPDAAFIALMHDFTTTYAGKNPSTEDFRATVERHMSPRLNARGDGKIDWFFEQWIYGTEVPRLASDLSFTKLGKDEYKITGTVTVADVSPEFMVLVPLYAELSKGRLAGFGNLGFKGPGTKPIDVTIKLPEKPKRIFVNGRHEVLAK